MTVQWCQARLDDVPADDAWLTGREHAVMAGLAIAKRRADWRLGRWTSKMLIATILDLPPDRVEIRAADDGAPEALVDGAPTDMSLSLSHRDGVAVAAVVPLPTRVGIDLETLETRSDAFVREWLADDEQAELPRDREARDVQVLCCWTAKEASAKVLREGLRLDLRDAVVAVGSPGPESRWAPLEVTWRSDAITHRGWWRRSGAGILAIVTDPAADRPVVALAHQVAT